MEGLEIKYETTIKALKTLHEVLEVLADPHHKYPQDILRDSVIQRFEYSIDIFWKLLKKYLQKEGNILVDDISPRAIVREALNAGLITHEEFMILNTGIADRNLTSHSYNEKTAEDIIKNIPLYYTTMITVINKIKL